MQCRSHIDQKLTANIRPAYSVTMPRIIWVFYTFGEVERSILEGQESRDYIKPIIPGSPPQQKSLKPRARSMSE